MDVIFWDFFILYQIYFSTQVKRSVIISNKHGINKSPHELPNNLRLTTTYDKDKKNLKAS